LFLGLHKAEEAAHEKLEGGEEVTPAGSQRRCKLTALVVGIQTVTDGTIGRGVYCEIDKPLRSLEA
jgi:hypothetical protein